jgi:hypothetical protein
MWCTNPDSRGKAAKAPVRAMKPPKKGCSEQGAECNVGGACDEAHDYTVS